jgi:hypothetical protein
MSDTAPPSLNPLQITELDEAAALVTSSRNFADLLSSVTEHGYVPTLRPDVEGLTPRYREALQLLRSELDRLGHRVFPEFGQCPGERLNANRPITDPARLDHARQLRRLVGELTARAPTLPTLPTEHDADEFLCRALETVEHALHYASPRAVQHHRGQLAAIGIAADLFQFRSTRDAS